MSGFEVVSYANPIILPSMEDTAVFIILALTLVFMGYKVYHIGKR